MDREALQQFRQTAFKVRQGFLWFLRFVSLFLLIAVLLLAITRKLPWKVTTVLALVPVLGITVPRKLLVWVWLLPLAGFIGIYIWIQLPGQSRSDWHAYQFETEREVLSADWQMAPDDNAAMQYEQVLADYGESVFGYHFMSRQGEDATFNGPWRSQEYPKLALWLKTFDEGIAQLLETSKMDRCRFAIVHDLKAMQAQQKRINQLKGWARLLLRSANLDLGEGRFEQALEKQLAVVRIAQHLYSQQSLFDQTGAFHIELLASRALERTIIEHCNDPATLETIQAAFLELDSGWAKSWQAIVEREKLMVKNIAGVFYEVNNDGRIRITRQAIHAMQEGLGFRPRRLFLKEPEMNRLAVIGLRLSLPFTPDGMADLIDKRFDYYSLQTQKGHVQEYIAPQHIWQMGWNCRTPVDWQAMQQVKWFWALDGQDKRHDALENLMQIFVGLKHYQLEHNRWPEELNELAVGTDILTDPVHGKPFAYQQVGDGFGIYSLGPNGIDDNGMNIPAENKDDIVFWPREDTDDFDEAVKVKQTSSMDN